MHRKFKCTSFRNCIAISSHTVNEENNLAEIILQDVITPPEKAQNLKLDIVQGEKKKDTCKQFHIQKGLVKKVSGLHKS